MSKEIEALIAKYERYLKNAIAVRDSQTTVESRTPGSSAATIALIPEFETILAALRQQQGQEPVAHINVLAQLEKLNDRLKSCGEEHNTISQAIDAIRQSSATAEHWMLKAHEFQSRLYASGNFIANDAIHATEFKFANGRRVWVGQDGFLQCSYEAASQEEAPLFTHPPAARGLSDEEIIIALNKAGWSTGTRDILKARAVLAANTLPAGNRQGCYMIDDQPLTPMPTHCKGMYRPHEPELLIAEKGFMVCKVCQASYGNAPAAAKEQVK